MKDFLFMILCFFLVGVDKAPIIEFILGLLFFLFEEGL